MIISTTHLLLEIIAPKELRFVFYDFSDRLFFKFIYRPISKIFNLLKKFFLFNLTKLRDLLMINEKRKIIKERKKAEKKILKDEQKRKALLIKNQKKEVKKQKKLIQQEEKRKTKTIKREEKLQANLVKKEKKLHYKMENKRLKNETTYKIKLIIAYKIKKLINKNKTR